MLTGKCNSRGRTLSSVVDPMSSEQGNLEFLRSEWSRRRGSLRRQLAGPLNAVSANSLNQLLSDGLCSREDGSLGWLSACGRAAVTRSRLLHNKTAEKWEDGYSELSNVEPDHALCSLWSRVAEGLSSVQARTASPALVLPLTTLLGMPADVSDPWDARGLWGRAGDSKPKQWHGAHEARQWFEARFPEAAPQKPGKQVEDSTWPLAFKIQHAVSSSGFQAGIVLGHITSMLELILDRQTTCGDSSFVNLIGPHLGNLRETHTKSWDDVTEDWRPALAWSLNWLEDMLPRYEAWRGWAGHPDATFPVRSPSTTDLFGRLMAETALLSSGLELAPRVWAAVASFLLDEVISHGTASSPAGDDVSDDIRFEIVDCAGNGSKTNAGVRLGDIMLPLTPSLLNFIEACGAGETGLDLDRRNAEALFKHFPQLRRKLDPGKRINNRYKFRNLQWLRGRVADLRAGTPTTSI